MDFEVHCMSILPTELSLFNYDKVKSVLQSMSPLKGRMIAKPILPCEPQSPLTPLSYINFTICNCCCQTIAFKNISRCDVPTGLHLFWLFVMPQHLPSDQPTGVLAQEHYWSSRRSQTQVYRRAALQPTSTGILRRNLKVLKMDQGRKCSRLYKEC